MTAPATDLPVVTAQHLATVIGCSAFTLHRYLQLGELPKPDARGRGNAKLWKISTLRDWRPDIATAAVGLVTRKTIPLHRPSDSLPTAA